MKEENVIKKVILLVIASFILSPAAWARTDHTGYATMAIKDCNECHAASNVEPTHGSFWVEDHRLVKDKLPANCKDCHQQSWCMDCHYGGGIDRDLHVSTSGPDYMPKSHRTDFREIHPIKAREDPRSCYRCHDAKAFCEDCHSKFRPDQLAMVSHRKQFSDINVKDIGPNHAVFNEAQCPTCHPNGELPIHRWSSEHAREARRNLSSCQACHPDGDVCMKCHSAQIGLMINPHPRSWGSIKGRLRSASDSRTCLKCHAPGTF
jgi:hypothetical protein